MEPLNRARVWLIAGGAVVFILSVAVAYGGSLVLAPIVGAAVLGGLLWVAWRRSARDTDLSRRTFLRGAGLAGLGLVAGGSGLGRVVQRATRSDPAPVVHGMARAVGSEGMAYLKRGHFPGRSGDLQLVLAPFNTSNYSFESLDLAPKDPRSSHAMGWGYTERVPLMVFAPGIVTPRVDRVERVTLADLAPSAATLLGFDFRAMDGRPLPGLPRPRIPPKVIVVFVIDGGGWNVLTQWPTAWPTLRGLMRESLTFQNAVMGSFPSVTASAHATIGTGAFPATHGISGHWIRLDGRIVQAYGSPGHADPTRILVPTLAETWTEHTRNRAWVGEIGYQVWHLGMLGKGGRPLGRNPVAIYYDEDRTRSWRPHNEDLFRLPADLPGPERLSSYLTQYFGPVRGAQLEKEAGRKACCSPPIIRYQGDVIETAFGSESIGGHDETDLLFVNYKMPDYTGHVYNMLSIQEKIALAAVDRELARLVSLLQRRFKPGEFALFVTADHGQCPLVDVAGGVRLDPIQLARDINNAFGRSLWPLTDPDAVRPSEVYLDHLAMWDAGVKADDIAAFLADYRYGDNVGPYVRTNVVARDRRRDPEFAGVFPTDFIARLGESAVARFGPGRYPQADPGIPPPA